MSVKGDNITWRSDTDGQLVIDAQTELKVESADNDTVSPTSLDSNDSDTSNMPPSTRSWNECDQLQVTDDIVYKDINLCAGYDTTLDDLYNGHTNFNLWDIYGPGVDKFQNPKVLVMSLSATTCTPCQQSIGGAECDATHLCLPPEEWGPDTTFTEKKAPFF